MPGTTPVPAAVVLVHGAFAGPSAWARVAGLLRAAGLPVHAPANPLRGLAGDAAHLRGVVRRIEAPVVLVGHGYGGAVVTQAATGSDNVVALAYVAAFGLDAGESVRDVTSRFPPMPLADASLTTAVLPPPPAPGRGLRLRADLFPQVYAGDLPPSVSRALSAAQRPVAPGALTDEAGSPPAWACLPSSYAIATADRLLSPTAQRFMAQRMAATEHVLDGSHAVVLSRPDAVAAMIREAAGRSV